MSRRLDILLAIVDRLELIQVANGFSTDAGATLFVNEAPALGPDDSPVAIALMVQPDEPRAWQGDSMLLRLPLEIQAHAFIALEDAWAVAERVLEDIKRAVEMGDRTLGRKVAGKSFERGTTSVVARVPGSTSTGLGIRYTVPYQEKWGEP